MPHHNPHDKPRLVYSTRYIAKDGIYDGARYRTGWKVDYRPLSATILNHATSPIIFKNGVRLGVNFIVSYCCVLDFDGPDTPMRNAIENVFCDVDHLIATTRSHQKVKDGVGPWDRYRLWALWERPITDHQTFIYNMNLLIKKYDTDVTCKDLARFYFPCQEIVSIVKSTGGRIEVKEPTKSWVANHNQSMVDAAAPIKHITKDAHLVLKGHIDVGDRNQCFYRGCRDLFRAGYSLDQVTKFAVSSPTYINSDPKHQQGFLVTVRSALNNLRQQRDVLNGQK